MKTTEWFPHDVKPLHAGVYETQSPYFGFQHGWYSYWNGEWWARAYNSVDLAYAYCDLASASQNRPWRGIV